jgi:muramoyltetrapeptide carboxypeptidase
MPLKPSDLVDIVSPGSGSRIEDVEAGIELLESWGLKTRLPKETFAAHPFHSNEDEMRFELFKKAIQAKDSRAVWCIRGGYGANRLLPKLWNMKVPEQKKILVGYSDITSIHLLLNQKWKWPSFHGPLLESMISGRMDIQQITECRAVVFGEKSEMRFQLQPMNDKAKKIKTLSSSLIGGNLVVLQSAIGTPYAGQFKDKILFLEEVGERGYRIDRMLEHFNQAQALKSCKAIVFGDFLLGDERDGQNFVKYALQRFAGQNQVACFSGLPTGHGKDNRMIPLGTKAQYKNGELVVATGLSSKTRKEKLR